MGTEISKKFALAAAVAVAVGAVVAGCGGSSATRSSSATRVVSAWLAPTASPPAWPTMTIGHGATLSYPSGWRRVHGDPGTASAMLFGTHQQVVGYLNLTPRQGAETQADWGRFRIDHNRDEGDRSVRTLRTASGLRFLTGHGSCVQDSYTTSDATRYVEIACLIAGQHSSFVAVGATPPDQWPHQSAVVERAIEGVRG